MLIVYSVFMVFLLFGITIFVHELGHFLVARWLGLRAEVFSIGFGPALWKKKHHGVTYKIGALPLGGYVALPQMDPGGNNTSSEGEPLPPVEPWKKILVALAGVTGNMILAFLIAYIVYWGGKSYAPAEAQCTIGWVETNSVAYAQGLRIGDSIVEVNGKSVGNWEEFVLGSAFFKKAELVVDRADGTRTELTLPTDEFMGARHIPGLAPLNYCYVLNVVSGSSAEEAGLKPRDKIIELDGVKLYSRGHLTTVVDERAGQLVPIKFERDGEVMESMVRPAYNEKEGRALIGIAFNTLDVKKPWPQIKSHATLIFRFLGALLSPKEARAAAQGVAGPVAIFALFWFYVQTGLIAALWFTGLLNVNLAVLNLLPIPILDGGHIVFSLIEAARRKPLSPRLVNAVSNVFMVLLLAVFLLISYRDVVRLPKWSSLGATDEAVPAETIGDSAPATAPATVE